MAAALLTRAMGSRANQQKLLSFATKITKKGIARRKARVQAGQPVMFQRIRNRRIRLGKSLPIRANANTTSRVRLAPVAVNKTVTQNTPESKRFIRTEMSFNLNVMDNTALTPMSIIATNDDLFSALPPEAAQYQYYKFEHLSFDYSPALGYDQNGLIAIGVAATYPAASATLVFSDIANLAHAKQFPARGEASFDITPAMMSQQYPGGFTTTPYADLIDANTPTAIQGYLIFATQNTGLAVGTILGTMTVSYSCLLSKAQVQPAASQPAEFDLRVEPAAVATPFASFMTAYNALVKHPHEGFTFASGSANHLTITSRLRRPFVINITGGATTAATPVVSIDSVTGGVTHWSRFASAAGGYAGSSSIIFYPNTTNSTVTLLNAADHWGLFDLSVRYIRPQDADYIADELTP